MIAPTKYLIGTDYKKNTASNYNYQYWNNMITGYNMQIGDTMHILSWTITNTNDTAVLLDYYLPAFAYEFAVLVPAASTYQIIDRSTRYSDTVTGAGGYTYFRSSNVPGGGNVDSGTVHSNITHLIELNQD